MTGIVRNIGITNWKKLLRPGGREILEGGKVG